MLRAPEQQYLEPLVGDQFLQVSVDGAEAHLGQPFARFVVNPIGSRVGAIVLNRLPDDFQLLCISGFLSTFDISLPREILH